MHSTCTVNVTVPRDFKKAREVALEESYAVLDAYYPLARACVEQALEELGSRFG